MFLKSFYLRFTLNIPSIILKTLNSHDMSPLKMTPMSSRKMLLHEPRWLRCVIFGDSVSHNDVSQLRARVAGRQARFGNPQQYGAIIIYKRES